MNRQRRKATLLTALAVMIAGGGAAWPSPARADATYHVYHTGGVGLKVRTMPSTSSGSRTVLSEGSAVTISCQTVGENIQNSKIWDRLADGGYVSDWYVDTPNVGTFTPGIGQCEQAPVPAPIPHYERAAAAKWATDNYKTSYRYENEDCTYFASRALWAGGLPKSTTWTDSTTDPSVAYGNLANGPQPSVEAVSADRLKNYLVNEAKVAVIHELDFNRPAIEYAQLGDLIAYDWNDRWGLSRPDGVIDHLAVITTFSATGYPLVSAHSNSLLNGGWRWSYTFGKPITDVHHDARAYLIHIVR